MNTRRNILQESLEAIERLQARVQASEGALHQPIAIVGAGCRYPGGIESPEALWDVVREGRDRVSGIPADRWNVDAYYDPDPQAPGKMVTRRGGFLTQVDRFDAQFFGISPREATTLDPQQRLLLETAQEALDSAAIATDRLVGSLTGVFVGITMSDYAQLLRTGGAAGSDVYSATGSTLNAAAGRLSFTFGFQGPCVAVDTACSSSLVAVHMACQSLRTGESRLALAGGVNVILAPDAMVLFSKWGMLAPDGACKTFDAAANGFVRAEGCAVIALKRLADAIADGDPILALIRGSAVNSDGRSSGLTVPNGLAQQAVIRAALASGRLKPAEIDYVEAHGTGTSLGDPIEVEALGAVLGEGRSPDRPLAIGSIKTNIGHAEAASGLAGLLKVVMSLKHEAIPPHLHFSTRSPGIPWDDLPVTVPTRLQRWPRGGSVRRAGVSSFGFSGTNAHVVLEEAPAGHEVAPPLAVARPPGANELYLVPLSARDTAAAREMAGRYADFLATTPAAPLVDVATTLAVGRTHYSRRFALICDSSQGLQRDLRALSEGQFPVAAAEGTARTSQPPKIAFLFTGQGAQYAGMGRGLYDREPVFRTWIDKAAAVLTPLLERPLLDVLFPQDGADAALAQTAYTQPALFALEYALAELWGSWGIRPSIVAGHSVGEYVAACVAGVFSFEEGLTLIAERARLMQALPAGGGMVAVFAAEEQVARHIGAVSDLSIAAVNGAQETVVAGESRALARLVEELAASGLETRPLEVSHAFHSSRLDPMLDALERRAATVKHASPRIPLVSNLTGSVFARGAGPDANYWRRHAREPVRFAACIEAMRSAGATILLEVGPHPTLLGLAARAAPTASWATLASLRRGREDRREMLAALAALYVRGASIDWDAFLAGRGGRRIAMPTYAFQRERYWLAAPELRDFPEAGAGHPLLGERRELAGVPGAHLWERDISLESHPWLGDHRVQGVAIVPATAYIEMALAAACEVLGESALSVREIENLKPIILVEGIAQRVQTTLTVHADGGASFAAYSRRVVVGARGKSSESWVKHMTAKLARIESSRAPAAVQPADFEAFQRGADITALSGEMVYALLAKKGNEWGACFQGVRQLWRGPDGTLARVEAVSAVAAEMQRYLFHPALADSCAHALVATVPLEANAGPTGGAVVGGGVGEIRFHRSPSGRTLWSRARVRAAVNADSNVVTGDIEVYDESGALVLETLNARLWYLNDSAKTTLLGPAADWFYETRWSPRALAGASERSPGKGPWLLFADRGGLAERVAASLRAAGVEAVLVFRGTAWAMAGNRVTLRATEVDDYRRLVTVIDNPATVLHFWSLDSVGAEMTGERLSSALELGVESALHVLQSIRGAGSACRPRLWLITTGAQPVLPSDRCEAPWNAALWGLGRSLSAEHAEIWGGLMDISATEGGASNAGEELSRQLIHEVEMATAEDKVAFRGSQRYVARLERRGYVGGGKDLAVGADGTYLITGGLGGIGLATARWLAEQGAKHLLLCGRTPLPAREEWASLDRNTTAGRRAAAIADIEALGAKVEVAAIDLAANDSLQHCLEARRAAGCAPVRGVLHAAGVLQLASLESESVASLRAGLAAKVLGAWQLHRFLATEPVEWFVLCSSASALLNSPLLGAYAAGNAFLDALAHHRRASGLPALSINWGVWGEVGMAVQTERDADGALAGVRTLSTAAGLAALRELIETGATQAAVMPMDWNEFSRAYPAFVTDPFLRSQVASFRPGGESTGQGLTLATLSALSPDARADALGSYLRTEAARVLGFIPERLDVTAPLSSFGFDSLMAVQLKNRIESDLGVVVPMIQFLKGPSVEQLGPTLLALTGASGQATTVLAEAAEAGADAWEEGSL